MNPGLNAPLHTPNTRVSRLGRPFAEVSDVAEVTETSPAIPPQETSVPRFDIPDMTCGHCIEKVTEAVRSVDPAAQVQAALSTHSIDIVSTAGATILPAAIAAAGHRKTQSV